LGSKCLISVIHVRVANLSAFTLNVLLHVCLVEQFKKLACEYLATFLCVKLSKAPGTKKTEQIGGTKFQIAQESSLFNEGNHLRPKGSPTSLVLASAAETEAASAAGQQLVSGTERLLVNIRDLLQTSVSTMTQLRRDQDENQRMMNDWMVAAAVIDRISFILITCLFIAGTVTLIVFCTIPHN